MGETRLLCFLYLGAMQTVARIWGWSAQLVAPLASFGRTSSWSEADLQEAIMGHDKLWRGRVRWSTYIQGIPRAVIDIVCSGFHSFKQTR